MVTTKQRELAELLKKLDPKIRTLCSLFAYRPDYLPAYITVDDLAQEVRLAIIRALPTMNTPHPTGNWVAAITRNRIADVYRSAALRPAYPVADIPDRPDAFDVAQHVVDRATNTATVEQLLDILTDLQRQIVLLHARQHTAAEIGQVVGMTPGAVRVAHHRAMAELRQHAKEAS